MEPLGFLVIILIAVVVGFLGDSLISGQLPFGWAVALIVGVIGSTIGTALFGGWGPGMGGVYVFPALLGAVFFVGLLEITLSALIAWPSS